MSDILEAVSFDGVAIRYLDQRLLPGEIRYEEARSAEEIVDAIVTLAVRGAPCIGVFAAYGIALLRKELHDDASFAEAAASVRAARPTAVNLSWAVDRVLAAEDMEREARAIHEEQRAIDAAIAEAGLELITKGTRVLTHCNTGPIATAGLGSALGILIAAQRAGLSPKVLVDETRPLLQGARLTYLECERAGIDATLQADGAAALAMKQGLVDAVLVGADRIARNGDTANKIGTYGLAILAAHHGLPFYVAAPRSTFDFTLADGSGITIEERDPREVTHLADRAIAPIGARAFNPAFDVTPGHLIAAIVTEYGILRSPFTQSIATLAERPHFRAVMTAEALRS
ncbi:MAG TPA: S-methyl-5-thioribose-1-phosphate isomerase [Candidatus Dormibacteraeota bacterium]|nr:S-methyl-5-thioribose-1-phosphate isomerase [Candidatus Dormibacteraeota bacterium]